MKRWICFMLLAALLAATVPQGHAVGAENALTALFDTYTEKSGAYTLKESARFYLVCEENADEATLSTIRLAASEFTAKGLPSKEPLAVLWGPEQNVRKGDIRLLQAPALPKEGFSAEISSEGITLQYADGNGLLYGLRSVLKLFLANGGARLSACGYADAPDTPERTLMLDCARKYWSVEWIKNLICEMSWQGMNALELHLTEDQGIHANIWRDADGNTVPDVNGNDFGWLPGYKAAGWASNGVSGSDGVSIEDPNGAKNYSRDDLIAILDCAAQYHIEVIPSVDLPGHSDYLIDRWTRSGASDFFTFSYNGTAYTERPQALWLPDSNLYSAGSDYPQYGTVDVTNAYARNLTLALLQGYAAFFRTYGNSTSFNLGCDEIRGELSGDEFTAYVNEAAQLLRDMGYRTRAFNDYLYNAQSVALDADLSLCVWTQSTHAGVDTYLADNRTLYNCIQNYCYYALRNNEAEGDARSEDCGQWAFHHATAERIYAGCGGNCGFSDCKQDGGWNPTHFYAYNDASAPTVTGRQLGGGYFLVWGDWAGWCSEENVWNGIDDAGTYNLPDRLRASAAKMWCWDADGRVGFSAFSALTAAVGSYPGFTDCTSAPSLPEAKEPRAALGAKTQVTLVCKTKLGGETHILGSYRVSGTVGSVFSAPLPQLLGYRYFGAENASLFGKDRSTLYGPCTGCSEVTVWYSNAPLLGSLDALLAQLPKQQGSYSSEAWAAYQSVLDEAHRFAASANSTTTVQEALDAQLAALLLAEEQLKANK